MKNILHKELSYVINGILFDVHNEIGRFASEKQICDHIEKKLIERGVIYKRELVLPVALDEVIGRHRVDFLIENKIVLEIKHRKYLQKIDFYQLKRYLENLNIALGILVNFQEERLHPKRVLNGGGKE